MGLFFITLDHGMIRNDKEDDKDEEKEEQQKDVSAKGMFVERECYNQEEIWHGMQVHCELPEVTNKKLSIQGHTMHGRLKELVTGPSNMGPERWWAMLVIALTAFDAFVH
jgi:hypothetical protein